MKTANILLHRSPYYRLHVFSEGLKRHGYKIISDRNYHPNQNDLVLLWNRNPPFEKIAQRYEAAKATVLITENGYVGDTKALAKNKHAGAGWWFVGEDDRWSRLGVDVRPWRKDGDHILVLPQRSIGQPGVAMPRNWERTVTERLAKLTSRPIRVRKHPGKDRGKEPTLEQDLANAWAAVTWASGAGVKALIEGVPVFYDLKEWIGGPAGSCVWDIENPVLGDRMSMLHRLAWAQWTWSEIESGEAFEWLL